MTRINLHDLSQLSPDARSRLLVRTEADLSGIEPQVDAIIAAVRAEGDAALARFGREFDKAPVEAHALAASPADFAAAEAALEPEVREAMEFAARSIRRFHEDQKPEEMWLNEISPGAFAGERSRPIPSVACYVPRGKGAFPSVALMSTIPACVAGVADIVILTPPGPDGSIDAATLVAARMSGIERVYRVGGAQAVAAAAFGTATIPAVTKIVGPGSPWVVAAKRRVAHVMDTGTPAGPSELIVLADDTADGRLAALDLLIESEHGPDSSAYLVTWSRRVAEEALAAIPGYWETMGEQRRGFSETVLGGPIGGIVLARDEADAIAFVNDYAPEHLEILADRALPLPRRHRACRRNSARSAQPGHARQLRRRPEPRTADQRLGPHRLAALGLRLHEAHLGGACHLRRLSRARPTRPHARDLRRLRGPRQRRLRASRPPARALGARREAHWTVPPSERAASATDHRKRRRSMPQIRFLG